MNFARRLLTQRTDWFRVLSDLLHHGWNVQVIGDHIGVSRTTVNGWRMGSEPRHSEGERLIDLWRAITGRDRSDRPLVLR